MSLKEDLDAEMLAAYERAGRETGYWGKYFLRSVKKNGGLKTAKSILKKRLTTPSDQKGFRALIEAGRPDLSVENLVLRPRFRKLFTERELAEAQVRLDALHDYAKRVPTSPENNYPDELLDEKEFQEGAKKRVTVNAYERDPKARAACLKRYGYACRVCGVRFQDVYGDIGKRFIHVHHRKPLAGRRATYRVKPTIDLVPVCPNCHAMLHTSNPPLGVEELKAKMPSRAR